MAQSHLNTFFPKIRLYIKMQLLMEKNFKSYGLAALKGLVVIEVYFCKNSPSLATHTYLSIIPKVALIQLNSCQGLVKCCVQELSLDNTTAVLYMNNQGGTHSPKLMSLTLEPGSGIGVYATIYF